jgi:hypothetical protein
MDIIISPEDCYFIKIMPCESKEKPQGVASGVRLIGKELTIYGLRTTGAIRGTLSKFKLLINMNYLIE